MVFLTKSLKINKMLDGVIHFRKTARLNMVKEFEKLQKHSNPVTVLFTCMDARMTPLSFTNTPVGDMFIVRNAGNMIPHATCYGPCGHELVTSAEPAALDLTVKRNKIKHIVVCGHSDCRAMKLLRTIQMQPETFDMSSPLDHWVRNNGYKTLHKLDERLNNGAATRIAFSSDDGSYKFKSLIDPNEKYNVEDKLSLINTLQQIENVSSHGLVSDLLKKNKIGLHAFWFDIKVCDMHMYSQKKEDFVIINEDTVDFLRAEVNED